MSTPVITGAGLLFWNVLGSCCPHVYRNPGTDIRWLQRTHAPCLANFSVLPSLFKLKWVKHAGRMKQQIILQPAPTACQGLEHAVRLPMGQLFRYLRLDESEFTDILSCWTNLEYLQSPMIFVDLSGSTPLGWLRMLHWANNLVGIACAGLKTIALEEWCQWHC